MESMMAGEGYVEAQPTVIIQSHRERRGWRRLGVVVIVQSVVVALCCAVSLYVYWLVVQQVNVEQQVNEDHIYIELGSYQGISQNRILKFAVNQSHKVDVKAGKIKVECRGPYMLYTEVCVKNYDEVEAGNGSLELHIEGRVPRVQASFKLQAKELVCRWLHSTVYLKKNENITLHFYSPNNDLKIETMTLGLSYLLGTLCL